jgi:hypothetical protein
MQVTCTEARECQRRRLSEVREEFPRHLVCKITISASSCINSLWIVDFISDLKYDSSAPSTEEHRRLTLSNDRYRKATLSRYRKAFQDGIL